MLLCQPALHHLCSACSFCLINPTHFMRPLVALSKKLVEAILRHTHTTLLLFRMHLPPHDSWNLTTLTSNVASIGKGNPLSTWASGSPQDDATSRSWQRYLCLANIFSLEDRYRENFWNRYNFLCVQKSYVNIHKLPIFRGVDSKAERV
jgi:hypothetical protein